MGDQPAILSTVIPTVIVAGALIGRWWAVPVAAVAWPLLLVSAYDLEWSAVPGAAALAAANVAVGVLPRWALRQRARFTGRIPRPY
jgi:hypothetical protein